MRSLIYIPIIHSPADMGGFAEAVRRITIERFGKEEWERSVRAVNQMWRNIREEIERWHLPYPGVRIYQDGLPNCGREVAIVTDLAKAGSPNHQLLLRLMDRGAAVMGTESADLLLEEYQLAGKALSAGSVEEVKKIEERQGPLSRSLLEKRDRYIAERINITLKVGEIGLLFLGMLHSLDGLLPADIQVSYPMGRPVRHGKGSQR